MSDPGNFQFRSVPGASRYEIAEVLRALGILDGLNRPTTGSALESLAEGSLTLYAADDYVIAVLEWDADSECWRADFANFGRTHDEMLFPEVDR